MSINDATPADWDRANKPTIEQLPVSKISPELLNKHTSLAEDEQREKDRQRVRSKWSRWCVSDGQVEEIFQERERHDALAAGYASEETPIDPVNNPSHYNTGGVEAIQAIEASMSAEAFQGYLKGNCMKYIWRMSYKGKAKEDTLKAQWYLNRLIETL